MNTLEKKSFYSFLGLYIVSSFLFILLVGYWYYIAQKNALENETYYKMVHIADMKSGEIIMAHMHGREMKTMTLPENIKLTLIDTNNKVFEGDSIDADISMKPGYFKHKGYEVLVSDAPREHLNIRYVVVQSDMLAVQLQAVQNIVWQMIITIFSLIIFVAWILSKLFMKPIRQKVEQIERFINDVTHELNTPITALSMATDQALKQESYTEKTLKNISISTKQLYDIYSSLAYLNFADKKEVGEALDITEVLQKSISYYEPLCESKRIRIKSDIQTHIFTIPETQLQLLFGNLMGNAIKYSPAGSTITLQLKEGLFSIKDEGIGIDVNRQKEIFKKFKRGTEYAGGFGVGLSIVKSICDEYGIGMKLVSELDVGTEFILSFPKGMSFK